MSSQARQASGALWSVDSAPASTNGKDIFAVVATNVKTLNVVGNFVNVVFFQKNNKSLSE